MCKLMRDIAEEMQQETGAFTIRNPATGTGAGAGTGTGTAPRPPMILDMCAAPGIFLQYALDQNPTAEALGFTLPRKHGGYNLAIKRRAGVDIRFLDVTMLAADLMPSAALQQRQQQHQSPPGEIIIPPGHPHEEDFTTAAQLPPT